MKKSIGAKTVIYPSPILVVGSYDKNGRPNVMTAAWGGICCSQPPCLAVSLREATYTYGNVMHHQAFTVSIPTESYVKEVDYFGLVSGKDEDKFTVSGLTPMKSELVNAPYIEEFPFVLECKVIHTYKIGLHTQFIGEILDIKVEEARLDEKGQSSIERVKPILWAADSRGYYGIGNLLGKAFSVGRILVDR
jgi:flavin reductase (DIM6/NTAB) family NADH-FMN oxidoreductase RutF